MKKVIILQGIPGIGKSTYAKSFSGALICSADDFMYDSNGVYNWEASKLGFCHSECFKKFKTGLENNVSLVIVDNTNTRAKEIKPYMDLANLFGYDLEIVWLKGDPEKFGVRNVHGVSLDLVAKIQARLESFKLPRTIIEIT